MDGCAGQSQGPYETGSQVIQDKPAQSVRPLLGRLLKGSTMEACLWIEWMKYGMAICSLHYNLWEKQICFVAKRLYVRNNSSLPSDPVVARFVGGTQWLSSLKIVDLPSIEKRTCLLACQWFPKNAWSLPTMLLAGINIECLWWSIYFNGLLFLLGSYLSLDSVRMRWIDHGSHAVVACRQLTKIIFWCLDPLLCKKCTWNNHLFRRATLMIGCQLDLANHSPRYLGDRCLADVDRWSSQGFQQPSSPEGLRDCFPPLGFPGPRIESWKSLWNDGISM